MSAANKVIEGWNKGCSITCVAGTASIHQFSSVLKDIDLTREKVQSYEIIDGSEKKSLTSAVGRAAAGALLLGPVGLAAGLTAKKKGTYLIAITFKNGRQSLLEVDDKRKKAIITKCF